jgi:Tol biopolymer transport system component
MKRAPMCTLMSLVTLALLLACGSEAELPLAPAPSLTAQRSSSGWSDWSEPVNLGPVVNSPASDIAAKVSPDGRSLYFASNRPGGVGGAGNDIWVARRASLESPWETPVNLGPIVNSDRDDGGPSVSPDGRMLFFNSNRLGGRGAADLYVSHRNDPNDDFGWGPPVNLGPLVNTAGGERGPDYVAGRGGEPAMLYFNGGNLGLQQADLYVAPMTRDGEPLGPAELVAGVNAPDANDAGQSVSAQGRAIYFWSNRAGSFGDADLWQSTRRSAHDGWSTPVNLGAPPNTEFAEERPYVSRDGKTLFFDSLRPDGVGGSQDIWMSTRTRIGDDDDDTDAADGDPEVARYSEWSTPVNLGPIVNTAVVEADPFITKDGLSLYFVAGRGRGGSGMRDMWVSQRANTSDPWGPPQNLGPTINSVGHDDAPTLSLDGHRLYFASSRAGGMGGFDLYVSRRRDKRDDFGWEAPVNVGGSVNTAADETSPTFFEDEGTGTMIMYFTSNRPGGHGLDDIYASALHPDETFGSAVLVAELSTPFNDGQPTIRRDGLEMFLGSDRPGTIGNTDLWVATRARTIDPWSVPVNLGPVINSPPRPPDLEQANDFGPALSFDGTALYFASAFRPGNVSDMFDLWVSTRTKLTGPD